METKVNAPASATQLTSIPAQPSTIPASKRAAAPGKVETPQSAPAVDAPYKPALKQAARSSGLTTYKDEKSGRLVVRVYDRDSGDVLVEFPPEKAFREIVPAPSESAPRPTRSFKA